MKIIKFLTFILFLISFLIIFFVILKAIYSALEMIIIRNFIWDLMQFEFEMGL
jgi:hypothetical protein